MAQNLCCSFHWKAHIRTTQLWFSYWRSRIFYYCCGPLTSQHKNILVRYERHNIRDNGGSRAQSSHPWTRSKNQRHSATSQREDRWGFAVLYFATKYLCYSRSTPRWDCARNARFEGMRRYCLHGRGDGPLKGLFEVWWCTLMPLVDWLSLLTRILVRIWPLFPPQRFAVPSAGSFLMSGDNTLPLVLYSGLTIPLFIQSSCQSQFLTKSSKNWSLDFKHIYNTNSCSWCQTPPMTTQSTPIHGHCYTVACMSSGQSSEFYEDAVAGMAWACGEL